MEDCSSDGSSPTYASARQSPTDPDALSPFWTPSNRSPSDSAPRITSASFVTDTPQQSSIANAKSNIGTEQPSEDAMPPLTRRQERILASQTSMATDSSSPTVRARSLSPITRENILRDASPHSASYTTQLETAVDHITEALAGRGRAEEGQAVRELYNQSFKDPGSKVLLDALLRNRVDEKQKRDFKRYVQDVTRLGYTSPKVAVPARSPETSVLGKRRRNELVQIGDSTDNEGGKDEDNEGGVLLPVASDVLFKRSGEGRSKREPDKTRAEVADGTAVSKEQSEADAAEASDRPDAQGSTGKTKKTRRGRKGRGTTRKLANIARQTGLDMEASSELLWLKADWARLSSASKSALASHHHETGPRKIPPPPVSRDSGRKKKSNMFHGANGPVYSTNTLSSLER